MSVVVRHSVSVAGFSVEEEKVGNDMYSEYEVSLPSCRVNGLPILTNLMEAHTDSIELYFCLFSLLLKTNLAGIQRPSSPKLLANPNPNYCSHFLSSDV